MRTEPRTIPTQDTAVIRAVPVRPCHLRPDHKFDAVTVIPAAQPDVLDRSAAALRDRRRLPTLLP
ncbi:hypothetical protein [Kribbella karoonensis]|uniref:Uncharacterized protein n=1 Tax=Kribbella karoonensis TaxID=324851 RepID=A0ABN2E864_9ACTN